MALHIWPLPSFLRKLSENMDDDPTATTLPPVLGCSHAIAMGRLVGNVSGPDERIVTAVEF